MKKKITEIQLRAIVAESVKKVLREYNHDIEDWWRHNGTYDRERASNIPYDGNNAASHLVKTDEWWDSLSDEKKMEIYNDFFAEY